MKKALITMMCLAAMFAAGTCLKAQEITIVLEPGYNWISYPNAEAMPVVEALGSFTPSNGDIIQSQFGGLSRYFNGNWRGGVTHFIPGWGYHYYSARSEDVEFVFAHPASSSVATAMPTDITATSAVAGGMVMLPEGTHVFLRGVCWGTAPSPDIDGDHTSEETGIGSFSSTLEGLNPNTTYYVRAYAVSDHGLAYGNEQSFTTLSGIPVVTTVEVTDVTATTATCGGTVTDGGGLAIIARGVCWSTSHNPTLSNNHTSDGTGTGSFGSSLIALTPSTTYYVRAYATTAQATSYGEEMTFTTMNGIPVVTTTEVTDVTGSSAFCGGMVTDDGGLDITARGVCWSTSPNPTLSDSHTTDGTGTGSFTSSITGLSTNTAYYVRAYATNSYMTMYGNEVSFTTPEHAYVDLGLPSGTLWATCNVGADTPEGFGDYFAWGETLPKNTDTCNWNNYLYSNSHSLSSYTVNYDLTKYCNYSSYGYNGFTDNLTVLLPEDDAATANWGTDWCMPTEEEFEELYQTTTQIMTTQNGVYGISFISANGNSLFLPAAGTYNWNGAAFNDLCCYWSSSLNISDVKCSWYFRFGVGYSIDNGLYSQGYRFSGHSVRAVRNRHPQNNTIIINATASPAVGGTVTNTQSGAVCTLTAQANYAHTFTNWTENGEVVSTNANYSFTVTENRSLVANFTSAPTGAIDGKFTINSNGDQVYFSQGNLQYIGSAATPYWKFADNQWDVLGTTTGQNSGDQNVDRDLFGWGTSGYNHGANCYQPWSTSTSNSYYLVYGSDTYNLYDQTGQADWGYNPISNGGNQSNQWRTLTHSEWKYVFYTRTTTSRIRYAKAQVAGVNGVILLPDDWNTSTYSLSNTNTSGASFSSNTISASQWTTLQNAGAVFLPAAGGRYGTSVDSASVVGNGGYWSASRSGTRDAYHLYFFGTDIYTDYTYRSDGRSVRLVAPAEN